ncbi:MAG TPA: hypothetical protein VHK27_05600 [Gammaproteobacteria bacterium]|nr:hypothetical protein [Gammaproteobacteria bacterium]
MRKRHWQDTHDRFAKRYFTRLLVKFDCNVSQAAKFAGINRSDIYKKLQRYDVDHIQIAKDILANGKRHVIANLRRKLTRKVSKPNWDAPLPGYTPYQPKSKRNNNVRP